MTKTLRLILGDQLSHNISALENARAADDVIFMCEVWEEARYVKHHKKKIAFIFSAMRHFAEELRQSGFHVDYVRLDDADNTGAFSTELARAVRRHAAQEVITTEAAEYRVLEMQKTWADILGMHVHIAQDKRFLCTHSQFKQWAGERKQLRMEYFYREMRKTYKILMQGDEPEGGQWNYDAENRQPPKQGLHVPPAYSASVDSTTEEVLALVAARFPDHFGDIQPFYFAVTRAQALDALKQFIAVRLAHFGTYQDAMVQGEPWMYHAHIGFYLNCGLLEPLECVKMAEDAYHAGNAPLNAVEGFIRQIIGWREYVRGIYWLLMPEYAAKNALNATRPLPPLYWGKPTKMNCMKQCVDETKRHAYAHHIQRLMVLGNFALLAGLDVAEVNEWYLIVYADAYEWVEMPNVSGMVLYADGGVLASKPYAAGGTYINKMSDYCSGCSYKPLKKNGEGACPFNYLYWHFLVRNRTSLERNPRIAMMYRTYDRMEEDKRAAITHDASQFLKRLDAGDVV
jgi:deoxyribodipyrimidine photolyase-related protein